MTLTARLLYPSRENFENMLPVMHFNKSWYKKMIVFI